MFKVGAIYSYNYLWARESAAGEETGRKNRSACFLLQPPELPQILFLFAITSRIPAPDRMADRIPESECRRAGVGAPAWIILDEFNVATADSPYDFASLEPIGEFSPFYRKRIVGIVRSANAKRRVRAIKR